MVAQRGQTLGQNPAYRPSDIFASVSEAVYALGAARCAPIGMRRGLTRLEIAIFGPVANRFGLAAGRTSVTLKL